MTKGRLANLDSVVELAKSHPGRVDFVFVNARAARSFSRSRRPSRRAQNSWSMEAPANCNGVARKTRAALDERRGFL